jgi:phosphoribosylformimino-5-aminoimidazole carboxamide ribotide isomerase
MEIIPAIDIRDGNCVRLIQGDFAQETIFSDNPIETAKKWCSAGATRIHIVDLDGARTGVPQNSSIIKRIVESVSIPVQVGGGIRTIEAARTLITNGVNRIVLGTSAISNQNLIQTLIQDLGEEKLIIALDGRDGKVSINGWQEQTEQDIVEVAQSLNSYGISRIMYTDVSKDGVLSGPNIVTTKKLVQLGTLNIIASGGVSTLQHITDIKNLGCESVILGKSLYTKTIILEDAIAISN